MYVVSFFDGYNLSAEGFTKRSEAKKFGEKLAEENALEESPVSDGEIACWRDEHDDILVIVTVKQVKVDECVD